MGVLRRKENEFYVELNLRSYGSISHRQNIRSVLVHIIILSSSSIILMLLVVFLCEGLARAANVYGDNEGTVFLWLFSIAIAYQKCGVPPRLILIILKCTNLLPL